jgi:ferritin
VLNKAIEDAMNAHIKEELASAYLYLSMSAHCESMNFHGMAHWLRAQAKEELEHAMRFFDFLHSRGGRVVLQALEQPSAQFGSVVDLFAEVVRHEQKVTGLIHRLYELAVAEKDYASQPFLQSFVVEQIEEEKSAGDIMAMIQMAGSDTRALFLIDRELMKRMG